MKNFKNIVVIVALCAIGSATAKQMGTQAGRTPVRPETRPTTVTLKPLANAPAMTPNNAKTGINRELAHIEQNLNKIKNFAAGVLQNNKVSLAEKTNFMKDVNATYSTIDESMQDDSSALAQKLNQISGQSQEEEMSDEEMRMRRE